MKKMAATARMAPKPMRPMTPAPAAFLLTASVLLLITSKKPDGLLLCGSLMGACSLSLEIDLVEVDRVPDGDEDGAAGEHGERERGEDAQAAIAPAAERGVEQVRQPQEAIARRRGEELPLAGGDGRAIHVLEEILRRLDQLGRVGARGQRRRRTDAQERQILNEMMQPLVERGLRVGDARGGAAEEAIVG